MISHGYYPNARHQEIKPRLQPSPESSSSHGVTMLGVDDRWRGDHGIGRYAREVVRRLTVPMVPLTMSATPASPRDFFTPRRVPRGVSVVYSPGFNAGLTKVRQIVTVHDLVHLEEGLLKYRAYYGRILRPAIRKAGVVLTVSETSRAALRTWLDDDCVEIVNAGNGVSDAFTPGLLEKSPLHEYVLYVGNLKLHKNVSVILKALRSSPELRLVTVSPDPAAMSRAATDLGVRDRVTVMSKLTDRQLRDLYRGAKATVLPSTLEGFGLPALESICSGTPVVYWEGCRSVAEIVAMNGYAVGSKSDPDAWTEALHRVTPVSNEAAKATRLRYSWEDVAAKVQHVLCAAVKDAIQ